MLVFVMTPKADGNSTPLGQRPLGVLPVVCRLWASLRLGHLREWVEGWLPKSVFSLGNGLSSVEAGFSSLMSLNPLTQWIGPILDSSLGRLGLPYWFTKAYFAYHSQVSSQV